MEVEVVWGVVAVIAVVEKEDGTGLPGATQITHSGQREETERQPRTSCPRAANRDAASPTGSVISSSERVAKGLK